jgi:hypothetical protein
VNSLERSALRFGYLTVSLLGWLLFGILLRAELDQIGTGSVQTVALVALALYGIILLVGTPIGYAVISSERSSVLRSSERR